MLGIFGSTVMTPILNLVLLLLLSANALAVTNDFELNCLKSAIGTTKVVSYSMGFCYSFNPTKLDWSQALESCIDLPNGRLAFVTNQREVQLIEFEFDIKDGVWNGVTKSICQSNDTCDSAQEWVYVNGQLNTKLMDASLWAAGEPNRTAGDAALLTEQGYKVANSTETHPALCQYLTAEPQDTSRFVQRGRNVKGQPSAVSQTVSVASQHKCGSLCARQPITQCASYAYDPQTGTCLLYWLSSEQLSLTEAHNYILMDRQKPKIEATSCPEISSFNGVVTHSENQYYGRVPNGAQATMTCAAKERMIEGTNAKRYSNHTCIAPFWTPPRSPNCIPVCDSTEMNTTVATVSSSGVLYSDGSAPNGTDLTVSCLAWHYITDSFDVTSESAVCNSQNWVPKVPSCRRVQEWSFVTKTGTVNGDTGAPTGVIYIIIFGTEGTSPQIFPSNGATNYQYGAEDTFVMKTEVLGNVTAIELGTSSDNGWWVDWVQLVDIEHARTYDFTCGFWIELDFPGHHENITLTPN